MSVVLPHHTTIAGWARPWMAAKIAAGQVLVLRGAFSPLVVSHRTLTPSITTGCMVSAGDLSAVRVSGQVSWLAAMVKKSRRPLKVAMAAASEGGEGFDLHSVRQQHETFRALLH